MRLDLERCTYNAVQQYSNTRGKTIVCLKLTVHIDCNFNTEPWMQGEYGQKCRRDRKTSLDHETKCDSTLLYELHCRLESVFIMTKTVLYMKRLYPQCATLLLTMINWFWVVQAMSLHLHLLVVDCSCWGWYNLQYIGVQVCCLLWCETFINSC